MPTNKPGLSALFKGCITALSQRTVKLVSDTSGGVMIFFAVSLLVLTLFAGAIIDYGIATRKKSELQNFLDAATLAAAVQYQKTADEELAYLHGQNHFREQCVANNCGYSDLPNFEFLATAVASTIETRIPTAFMSIIGFEALAVGAQSVVQAGFPHTEVHIIADISASMDVPDSQEGIDLMHQHYRPHWQADTGCAFACHVEDDPDANGSAVADEYNIFLRRDRVRQEVGALAEELIVLDNVDVAVHIADDRFETLGGPSNVPGYVRTLADMIPDRSSTTYVGRAMRRLVRTYGPSGDGTSSSPRRIMVVVTDGVENKDNENPRLLSKRICDEVKAAGYDVIMLNVVYPIDEVLVSRKRLGREDRKLKNLKGKIEPRLRACSTDDQYYEGKFGDDVIAAFEDAHKAIGRKNVIYVSK